MSRAPGAEPSLLAQAMQSGPERGDAAAELAIVAGMIRLVAEKLAQYLSAVYGVNPYRGHVDVAAQTRDKPLPGNAHMFTQGKLDWSFVDTSISDAMAHIQ